MHIAPEKRGREWNESIARSSTAHIQVRFCVRRFLFYVPEVNKMIIFSDTYSRRSNCKRRKCSVSLIMRSITSPMPSARASSIVSERPNEMRIVPGVDMDRKQQLKMCKN